MEGKLEVMRLEGDEYIKKDGRQWHGWMGMVEERKGKNNVEVCIKTNKHSTKTRWTNLLKFPLDCPALFDVCNPKGCPKNPSVMAPDLRVALPLS